jgi:hypothetical protein
MNPGSPFASKFPYTKKKSIYIGSVKSITYLKKATDTMAQETL